MLLLLYSSLIPFSISTPASGSTRSSICAKFDGFIGVPPDLINSMPCNRTQITDGGCQWRGRAPLCSGSCLSDEEHLFSGNKDYPPKLSSKSLQTILPTLIDDTNFGSSCYSGEKSFCCKPDSADCRWTGRWEDTSSFNYFSCSYEAVPNKCGSIRCMPWDKGDGTNIQIFGEKCNLLDWNQLEGRAKCGEIRWYSKEKKDQLAYSWFKF